MRRDGLAAAVVAATLLAGAFPAGGAAAGRATYSTQVTFDNFQSVPPGEFRFYGRVISEKGKCANGRRVNFFFDEPGPNDRLLGYDYSDSRGHWSLQRPAAGIGDGDIYAKAPRKRIHNGVCRGDKSNVGSTAG